MRNIMRRNAESEVAVPQFKAPWNLILDAADQTQPGSRIKKLPLELMLDHIDRANQRVVDCDAELMLRETAHARVCEEYAEAMADGQQRLAEAVEQRSAAQAALLKVMKEHSVFEGMADIQKAIQDA